LAPNRDLGVTLQGDVFDQRVSYAIGLYNGAPDGRDAPTSDADDEHELAGRLFFQPFVNDSASVLQGLGFGIAASQGKKEGTGNNFLPRYRSPGQEQIFSYNVAGVAASGDHSRLSPQAYFYRNSFGLLAEHISSKQALTVGGTEEDLENEAWQVTASYVLTGEDASYRGVSRPNAPFELGKAGWGAFEVALRASELEIDDRAFPTFATPNNQVAGAKSLGLGLNWYLTSNVKAVFNYSNTTFDGGAGGGQDRDDEKVFITRVQYQF
jgi:phosphate-selective porin OprO and OprP